MQGPRRRHGWRCNPIGYQPNYTHIPNEKAWNLREAVFLKSVCAAPGALQPPATKVASISITSANRNHPNLWFSLLRDIKTIKLA